jgi:asparagine synthase (glutamine-hydrolysing)
MNETQHHRGPDEGDLHIEPGLGFGHRRLSVIDIETGQQPLFNEDRTWRIVFNGEIYNFRALRAELQALGHTFRTKSDTEVIVHAWEPGAKTACSACAACSPSRSGTATSRPCSWRATASASSRCSTPLLPDGMFVFGSELKSIMTFPELSREIDPRAVEDYFAYGYVPEPRTIFTTPTSCSRATR